MTTQNKNKMGVMPIKKLVLNVSLPLVVSMLVQSLYNIVDGIFVAKISENALTAISLSSPIQMLMISVAVGTGVGINSLLSRRLGEKKYDDVNKAAINGLFLALMTSLLFVIFGLFLVPTFFKNFTDNSEVIALGTSYLRICTFVNFGIFFAIVGERFLQATGNTFLSMIAQTSGAVVNIILDPILIFGLLGVPAMGIEGAAIATVTGQIIAAVVAFTLNKFKNKSISLEFKKFRPSGKMIKLIYKVGAPMILVTAMRSVVRIGMNKILAEFSITAVAVFGAYFLLQRFVSFPIMGLSQGLIPIVGFNYGSKNEERIKKAVKFTLQIAVSIMAVGTVAFLAFPRQLLGLYSASQEMLDIGIYAFRIMALTLIPMAFTVTIGSMFNGMGNGLVNMTATLLRQVLLLPCAFAFALWWGPEKIWYAFWVAEGSAMLFVLWRYARKHKKIIA